MPGVVLGRSDMQGVKVSLYAMECIIRCVCGTGWSSNKQTYFTANHNTCHESKA